MRSHLVALVILLAFATVMQPGAPDVSAHTKTIGWYSYGFSSGSEQATFSSVTYANGTVELLWASSTLQYLDWSCTCWRPLISLDAQTCHDCTIVKAGAPVTVQRFYGINCRRVKGIHGGRHGNDVTGASYSGAVCK